MTRLRQRMVEDMQLRGFAARTQEAYLTAVCQLARYHQKSPEEISDEELRQYFLYLVNGKKLARASITIALCGIKFLYQQTLKQEWPTLNLVRPRQEKRLPVVLSRDEVRSVLHEIRIPTYRACLTTIYACGLRLSEGRCLQVCDVDSARMLLHIHGKAKKDRYVPLPTEILSMLRDLWKTHRSPVWVFPIPRRDKIWHRPGETGVPVSVDAVQSAFRQALKRTGITKRAHVHTLRHSYGTHLLEDGINLRVIQELLGHRSPATTAIYTHLTAEVRSRAVDSINRLMQDL